jgi:hypothetical protein
MVDCGSVGGRSLAVGLRMGRTWRNARIADNVVSQCLLVASEVCWVLLNVWLNC